MTAQARRAEIRRATYQDVLDAPPHMVAEVVAGILHTQPRPAKRHAWASSGLGMKIGSPFNYGDGGPGGWWIIDEPELFSLIGRVENWRRTRPPPGWIPPHGQGKTPYGLFSETQKENPWAAISNESLAKSPTSLALSEKIFG